MSSSDYAAEAVDALNRQGIYHLDIKPANILYFDNGAIAKLADLGLARLVGASTVAHGLAPEKGVLGGTCGCIEGTHDYASSLWI